MPTCPRHRASTSWRWAASPRARPSRGHLSPSPTAVRASSGRTASRLGAPARSAAAADRFTRLAHDARLDPPAQARAAFWAARANLRARRPQLVVPLLRVAAQGSDEFYGPLAQRMLDDGVAFDRAERRAANGMLDLLVRFPGDPAGPGPGRRGRAGAGRRRDAAPCLARTLRPRPGPGRDRPRPWSCLRPGRSQPGARGPTRKPPRLTLPAWEPTGGYRLDPSLLHAVIRAESGFDPDARSPKGALGLMQIMPDTARHVAKLVKIAYAGDDWLLAPPNNMAVGQAWLRQLAATPTVKGSLIHLLAAYNAGEGRLQGWLAGELAPGRRRPAAVHRERAARRDPRLPQEGAGQSVGLPGPRRRHGPLAAGAGREPLARGRPGPGTPAAPARPSPPRRQRSVPGRIDESDPLPAACGSRCSPSPTPAPRPTTAPATRWPSASQRAGHHLAARAIVRDDRDAIAARLRHWIADPAVEVVITTGGTGVTGRDVTPEALAEVAEKHIAGFGELFRMLSYAKIGTSVAAVARRRRASPAAPTSSACRARPAPAATAGTRSCASSSTSATAPATSPSCCPACASTSGRAEPIAVWFTADTHFGHGGALGLFRRPFPSVAAMDAALVERWNATVAPADTVWHLGDFAVRVAPDRAAALLDTPPRHQAPGGGQQRPARHPRPARLGHRSRTMPSSTSTATA